MNKLKLHLLAALIFGISAGSSGADQEPRQQVVIMAHGTETEVIARAMIVGRAHLDLNSTNIQVVAQVREGTLVPHMGAPVQQDMNERGVGPNPQVPVLLQNDQQPEVAGAPEGARLALLDLLPCDWQTLKNLAAAGCQGCQAGGCGILLDLYVYGSSGPASTVMVGSVTCTVITLIAMHNQRT